MPNTLELTQELIRQKSVTPIDADCQTIISARLKALGFNCEEIISGPKDFQVRNLWAVKQGSAKEPKLFCFAGHTDVVPTGPLDQWSSDPFEPVVREGYLYGRGAADMKTSLASFVVATEEFIKQHPNHQHSIAFLLTSDEEGPAHDGTVVVCNQLRDKNIKLDYCVVGEPTSSAVFGDTIKNGRRGSLSGKLTIHGVQGHIAYPHLAQNPIHSVAPAIAELASIEWDKGNEYFPPTTWQISNIHAGTGATNVIPGEVVIDFNFRFSTASTADQLKTKLSSCLDKHGLRYDIQWTLGGEPFLTPEGDLSKALIESIAKVTGTQAQLSTTGGTSDGRFIAKICREVIEFGPRNESIHKINECIAIDTIEPLKNVYQAVLTQLVA